MACAYRHQFVDTKKIRDIKGYHTIVVEELLESRNAEAEAEACVRVHEQSD